MFSHFLCSPGRRMSLPLWGPVCLPPPMLLDTTGAVVMLDEEGYMALKPRPRNRHAMCCSRCNGNRDVSTSSRRYKISLWILGTGCVFLGSATIVLSTFVIQGTGQKRETGEEALNASEVGSGSQESQLECCPCSGEHVDLKKRLCGLPAERAECKLCPANWMPEKERCYWFSEGTKTWRDSQVDCFARGGHFLVIQDPEEMAFIQKNIPGEYRFWIGLRKLPWSKSWSWIDGSLYDQTTFVGSLSKARSSCAVVQVSQIRSEMCSDEFKWICEMETILL